MAPQAPQGPQGPNGGGSPIMMPQLSREEISKMLGNMLGGDLGGMDRAGGNPGGGY